MKDKSKSIFNILFNILFAIYPILVFYFLIYKKVPVRIFSIFTIALALYGFITVIINTKEQKWSLGFWNSVLLIVIGVAGFIINTSMMPKLFSVFINVILLYTFGITLFRPPVMIYRFAILADKSIPQSPGQEKIAAYCFKVTIIWVIFFIVNGSIAAFTVFFCSDLIWVIYNNAVAPAMTGLLFISEFIARKIMQKKLPKAHSVPIDVCSAKDGAELENPNNSI